MQRLLVCLVLLSAGCWARSDRSPPVEVIETSPAIDALLQKMNERLALMHDVARWKWNAKRPINDPERERTLLQDMAERGRAHQLDPDFTRPFFAAQIEAAKLVQEADFRQWQAAVQGKFADVPELAVLRQKIDGLNLELLTALARAQPYLAEPAAQQRLSTSAGQHITVAGADEQLRETAVRPLRRP